MLSVFSIFCSIVVSGFLLISLLKSFSVWFLLVSFLLTCSGFVFFILNEVNVWCNFDETMTDEWYNIFVTGEFFLFLNLMVPVFYLNDELGNISLSSPYGLPLLGLWLLVLSSFCLNEFEHCMEVNNSNFINGMNFSKDSEGLAHIWLGLTIFNGVEFLILQINEFYVCPVSVFDSAWYGCCLVLVTFHGVHVFVGICLLCYCYYCNFSEDVVIGSVAGVLDQYRYIGFTCFYWHFVDFIWFLVFVIVYLIP
uniref:Cytochrome c oxidase subunit 3 n=1 Tax=Eudiplozoon sp. DZ-2018 TaxID=2340794 RepID=A0A386PZ81_9PLAT|nr:cytochrome c oxidase subunit 3 [Eudiplozoon sp. DZ-2018]